VNVIIHEVLRRQKNEPKLREQVTVQAMLKTIRLLRITVSAGRSRSVKNAADTKLFAAPGLAKSKYRRFSRPASTAMHKRRSKNQVGLNCNIFGVQTRLKFEVFCAALSRKTRVVRRAAAHMRIGIAARSVTCPRPRQGVNR
jgi:hypothetical protein